MRSVSVMPPVMIVRMSLRGCMPVIGGRLDGDLDRRIAELSLQPAAEERAAGQRGDAAELPPEVRQGDVETVARIGSDPRPDQCDDQAEQHARRPGTLGEDGPDLLPVDSPEPEGQPQKE